MILLAALNARDPHPSLYRQRLADAMAYAIIKGLQDQEFLDKCCLGFDAAHMPEGDPSL